MEWQDAFKASPELGPRDNLLATVALLINHQVRLLRDQVLGPIFNGLSSDAIITCAVANANRGFAIIKDKAEAARKAADVRDISSLSTLSHLLIEPYEGASRTTPDDLHNSVVDTLPHWFAVAAEHGDSGAWSDELLVNCATRGGAFLSLEHVFRSVWQEVLWGTWTISPDGGGLRLDPVDREWQASWRIWDLRQQSLLLQHAILNRHLERAASLPTPQVLERTVIKYEPANDLPITIGAPEEQQAISHLSSCDEIEQTYLALFLDQEVGQTTGMTVRTLLRLVMVLQDLAIKALPQDYDAPSKTDRDWFERLSCTLPRERAVTALSSALGLSSTLIDSCISFLSVDPKAPPGDLFVTGLWHRPLITLNAGAELLIAVGPLVWGSPIRRVERWLQVGRGSDLSKTPNGMRYEEDVRAQIRDALANNPIFSNADAQVSSVPKGNAREEVDMLIRIGATVLVCEIKCLLGPSEPIEKNDYLRKLEQATSQACRKAKWIENEPELVRACVGDWDENVLRTLPLVVVNQSNGVGMIINGCHVTDAHFLRLFVSDGSYHSGAAFNAQGPGSTSFLVREVYSCVIGAEAAIPTVFELHPALQAYRDAVVWKDNRIPLSDGSVLSVAFSHVDYARYSEALAQNLSSGS